VRYFSSFIFHLVHRLIRSCRSLFSFSPLRAFKPQDRPTFTEVVETLTDIKGKHEKEYSEILVPVPKDSNSK
jgi:hypothetical protein